MKIIGVTGFAGVGKDTVADQLVTRYGYVKHSFAKPLKDMLRVLGVDLDAREGKELPHPRFGVSPRRMGQTLGTDWMRKLINPEGWILLAEDYVQAVKEGNRYADPQTMVEGIVFSDVRFQNEAEMIRKYGTLIHVVRPDAAPVEAHESEKGVPFRMESDRVLYNDKTVDVAYRRLHDIVTEL